MSKATITSVPATPTPETSGNSASLASTPFQLDGAERETRRYNPIEFLAWVRTIIKYSEIRGGLFDVAGIISCWQDYVLDAFHVELEAMKADGDLHSYGLDKPETLANIKEEILQEVATIVREDVHTKLLVRREKHEGRITRANAAATAATLPKTKEKGLRRRLIVVYLRKNQPETSARKGSRAKKSKKSKAVQRAEGVTTLVESFRLTLSAESLSTPLRPMKQRKPGIRHDPSS